MVIYRPCRELRRLAVRRYQEGNHVSATMVKSRPAPRERILIVDDEEDLLELAGHNLSKEGYRVQCVESGEKALAEARSMLPDLIVLDLLLPAVDGLEVCRLLKAD